MFHSLLEMLCATENSALCQSGYVNPRSSYLETRSLLSSQCDSKSHHPYCAFIPTCQQMRLHTPAETCVYCMLCWSVCAHSGACCASRFAARISDKPNESPERRYLPAYSCSVLSSLFFESVFSFLFSFLPPPHPPHPPLCCLSACTFLSQSGGFSPSSVTTLL